VRKYHTAVGQPHKPQVFTRFRVSLCFPITGILGIKIKNKKKFKREILNLRVR
jgi:hypothetical protein